MCIISTSGFTDGRHVQTEEIAMMTSKRVCAHCCQLVFGYIVQDEVWHLRRRSFNNSKIKCSISNHLHGKNMLLKAYSEPCVQGLVQGTQTWKSCEDIGR